MTTHREREAADDGRERARLSGREVRYGDTGREAMYADTGREAMYADTGREALHRLLADATRPGHSDELSGLPAAMAAFTKAHTEGRESVVKRLVSRVAAVKVAALIIGGTTAMGGVALASVTGALPTPLHSGHHSVELSTGPTTTDTQGQDVDTTGDPSGQPAGDVADDTDSTDNSGDPADQPSTDPEDGVANGETAPSPSLFGLCNAYVSGVAHSHGKALQNPAFTALATSAGGPDAIPTYCEELLATKHQSKAEKSGSEHATSHHGNGHSSENSTDQPGHSGEHRQDKQRGNSDMHAGQHGGGHGNSHGSKANKHEQPT